jgi:hypothetical protein
MGTPYLNEAGDTTWIQAARRGLQHIALVDRTIIKRDGSIVVRREYFYRNGMTAELFGQQVINALKDYGIDSRIVGVADHDARWPKQSYFEATIRPGASA